MLGRAFLVRLRLALLALVTVAMVGTGWAHRTPAASGEALAYIAATGATAADFCGDVGGPRHADPLCLACQIAGGADLPPLAGSLLSLKLRVGPALLRPDHRVAIARVLDLAHAPQGPPVA